jgi:hypothetical protein
MMRKRTESHESAMFMSHRRVRRGVEDAPTPLTMTCHVEPRLSSVPRSHTRLGVAATSSGLRGRSGSWVTSQVKGSF